MEGVKYIVYYMEFSHKTLLYYTIIIIIVIKFIKKSYRKIVYIYGVQYDVFDLCIFCGMAKSS
jgi:hypothetical protein